MLFLLPGKCSGTVPSTLLLENGDFSYNVSFRESASVPGRDARWRYQIWHRTPWSHKSTSTWLGNRDEQNNVIMITPDALVYILHASTKRGHSCCGDWGFLFAHLPIETNVKIVFVWMGFLALKQNLAIHRVCHDLQEYMRKPVMFVKLHWLSVGDVGGMIN